MVDIDEQVLIDYNNAMENFKENITSYEDMVKYYSNWINGKVDYVPNVFGKCGNDDQSNLLQKLLSFGFLITNWRKGLKKDDIEYRSYVCGFISRKLVIKNLKHIDWSQLTDIIYSWVPLDVIEENNEIRFNVGKRNNIQDTNIWFNSTYEYLWTFEEYMSDELQEELVENYVYIQFVDEQWFRGDYLLETLIKVIESCEHKMNINFDNEFESEDDPYSNSDSNDNSDFGYEDSDHENAMLNFKETVESYEDVLIYYNNWMNQKIDYIPGNSCKGHLAEDSQKQVHLLQKLLSLGFLTTSSQDGLKTDTTEQRAYVHGFMTKDLINELEVKLKEKDTDILFDKRNVTSYHNEVDNETKINVTIFNGKQCTNSWFNSNYTDMLIMKQDMNKKLKKEFYNNMIWVQFVDSVWYRSNYLLETLIELIESSPHKMNLQF